MLELSSYNLLFVVQEFFVTNFLRKSHIHVESLTSIDFRSTKKSRDLNEKRLILSPRAFLL